jgi:hypothetical protein
MEDKSTMSGYLIVRRINPATDVPIDNPIPWPDTRSPVLNLSHEEVQARYRGFDGWPWPDDTKFALPPLTNGLAVATLLPAIEEYYKEVSKSYSCDLIYLDYTQGIRALIELPTRFKFLGYDYGYYVGEDNLFSSLFHEVIYGVYDDMTRFSELINDNLLLLNIEAAEQLHRTRTNLLEANADLERNGEVLTPIAIYGLEHRDS